MSDDLKDVKADLARVAEVDGDILCRAALREIEALEAKMEKAAAMLEGLDKLVVWESLGLGYDLADRVEATIAELKEKRHV